MIIALDHTARLRRAEPDDLDSMVAIERRLPMPAGDETRRGGFLLTRERERQRELLAVARVWLLEVDAVAAGFCVTLDDAVLRASPIWARRAAIHWDPSFDVDAALARPIAYFDQLAVLPGLRQRYWGAALALHALAEQIDQRGHELVLTTTVIEPVRNRAAVPHLDRVGGRRVGRIDEHYQGVGRVVSVIHAITAARYRAHIRRLAAAGAPATRRILAAVARIDIDAERVSR